MDAELKIWHVFSMPKRSSKKPPADFNQLAAQIAGLATSQDDDPMVPSAIPEKNSAAVALGRLGGLKGGKARADSLTPAKRAAIAKKAAAARWSKK